MEKWKLTNLSFIGIITFVTICNGTLGERSDLNGDDLLSGRDMQSSYGGLSLIDIAYAKHGFSEMIEVLVEDDIDINAVDNYGDNLLLLSALAGRSRQELELLLDYGASWNITNKYGHTALHYAAAVGNLEALELFRSLGADIEARSNSGRTPLHEISSAKQNFFELLTWFVDAGANIHAVDNKGNNLAIISAKEDRSVYELRQIVESGVDWNKQSKEGQTVLHYAATGGRLKALKYFRSLGANINARNVYEETPVLRSLDSKLKLTEILPWFIEEGADLNVADVDGNNLVLNGIITNRTLDELKLLVKSGVNWNTANNQGQTVLHYASAYGSLEALQYFKSLGADINAKNSFGRTPLMYIVEVKKDFDKILTWFVKEGADMNAVDEVGINLIMLLVKNQKSTEEFKLAIKFGVHWEIENSKGETVMHYAASVGNLEALKYFESLGADIDTKNENGLTPLLMAPNANTTFVETLHWFAEDGADVHAVDDFGYNLILSAVRAGRPGKELGEILKLGVDWNVKNKKQQSVFQVAISNGNVDALKFFKALKAKTTGSKEKLRKQEL